jgi:hypothetical protein
MDIRANRRVYRSGAPLARAEAFLAQTTSAIAAYRVARSRIGPKYTSDRTGDGGITGPFADTSNPSIPFSSGM